MKNDDDLELSALLKRWEEAVEVPNTFRPSVWSKIAARQEEREQAAWRYAVRMISDFFAKPAFATATAAVVLALSVGAAHVHAERVSEWRLESAESAYVTSISPLARVGTNGEPVAR